MLCSNTAYFDGGMQQQPERFVAPALRRRAWLGYISLVVGGDTLPVAEARPGCPALESIAGGLASAGSRSL